MQTIELECPSCGELLELDTGFAGGVCRCSSCSTLMTVPADAMSGGTAEELSRPDRPDRPDAPGMEASQTTGVQERASTRRTPSRKPAGRGKKPAKGKRKTKDGRGKSTSRRGERIEQGEYVTASGKTIQIDRATSVPTANRKRAGVRIATVVVFFAIVLGIVAGGALAVMYMWKDSGGGNTPDEQQVEADPTQFDYRKSANPFTLEQPNIAGLPMHGTSVAIVVDVSDSSSYWLESVVDMLGAGLTRDGGKAVATVYAATPDGAETHRGGLGAASLQTFFTELSSDGDPSVASGIRRAFSDFDKVPDMLVIITSQPSEDEVQAWKGLLAGQSDTEVQVVLVDGFATSGLRSWLKDREGSRAPISLSGDQILNWQDESQ